MQYDVGVSGVELPVAGLGPRHDLHFLGEKEIATVDHLHAYAATHSVLQPASYRCELTSILQISMPGSLPAPLNTASTIFTG